LTERERELVARATRGDRAAFDELIDPRWERMVRIARRVVGRREEAEDVAQGACLRVWETLDRFRAGEDLDAWIYRVVVNLSLDALRRLRARPEGRWAGPAGQGAVPFEAHDAAPAPDARLVARELERTLEEITRDLPPRQKAVFVLSRVEGLSAPEIGRIMGVAPSTVRNHLLQVRQQLARRLGGGGSAAGGDADE
jgi:RNA polymerase sigma-70 factor (ECF subfamily)